MRLPPPARAKGVAVAHLTVAERAAVPNPDGGLASAFPPTFVHVDLNANCGGLIEECGKRINVQATPDGQNLRQWAARAPGGTATAALASSNPADDVCGAWQVQHADRSRAIAAISSIVARPPIDEPARPAEHLQPNTFARKHRLAWVQPKHYLRRGRGYTCGEAPLITKPLAPVQSRRCHDPSLGPIPRPDFCGGAAAQAFPPLVAAARQRKCATQIPTCTPGVTGDLNRQGL